MTIESSPSVDSLQERIVGESSIIAEIERRISSGDYLRAYDVATSDSASLVAGGARVKLDYLRVLALARSGALDHAEEEMLSWRRATITCRRGFNKTAPGLRARVAKDRVLACGDRVDVCSNVARVCRRLHTTCVGQSTDIASERADDLSNGDHPTPPNKGINMNPEITPTDAETEAELPDTEGHRSHFKKVEPAVTEEDTEGHGSRFIEPAGAEDDTEGHKSHVR